MKELLLKKLEKLASKQAKYNFTREFLQELILQIIDRQGYFKYLAFVGGTALRIMYDLPRFSEDLDFSLVKKKGFNFAALLKIIKKELELNGYEIEEAAGKDKTVLSEFIRFKGLLYELGLAAHKSEKLFIKLEIDSNPPKGFETEVVLVNKNFLFKVQSYKPASLFASKLHAVLFRKYEKGRDYYDLLWFLTRNIPINYDLLTNATAQTEKEPANFDAVRTRELLLARIAGINFTSLLNDARPFLEHNEEAEYFRREYFISALEKYFHSLA
jgi:predicted nucleotidyltransferase component of viral defense system